MLGTTNVVIREVGPRDGFQNVEQFIPTDEKIAIIDSLIESGAKEIELTSFVHPKAVPQMADADIVVKKSLEKYKDVDCAALIPNLYGARRAVENGLTKVVYVISATESHNKQNVQRSIDESFEDLKQILEEFPSLYVRLSLAMSFHCPFEGKTPKEKVLEIIQRANDMGVDEITLCDSIGWASPNEVYELIVEARKLIRLNNLGLHLHNTQHMALANTLAGMLAGIYKFESSVGGLGGCPFAPGAEGNVSTESLVNMIEKIGINTGYDLEKLKYLGKKVEELK